MNKYLKLSDIGAYTVSFYLSNYIWNTTLHWSQFEKDTIGKQFVRSADSISANVAEGFGRYTKKDKIKFYRYSLGSMMEALDWNEKAYRRNILNKEEYEYILTELKNLPRELNFLIKFTNEKLSM